MRLSNPLAGREAVEVGAEPDGIFTGDVDEILDRARDFVEALPVAVRMSQ